MNVKKFSIIFCALTLNLLFVTARCQAESKISKYTDEYLKARDPFRSPPFDKILIGTKDELELYGLDSIKMIGVLTGPDRLRAMLQIPDGKTFLVSERMKVGIHQGIIKKITPDEVIVREKVKNILGEDEYIDSEIPLVGEKIKDGSESTTEQRSHL